MKLNVNPEYALSGYYDYYNRPAVVWVDTFGELRGGLYNPKSRFFETYPDPKRISLDGCRIEKNQTVALIRSTTRPFRDGRPCGVCGGTEEWGIHKKCCDVLLANLAERDNTDELDDEVFESIGQAIQKHLEKAMAGPVPVGRLLVNLLYYWTIVHASWGNGWSFLDWAIHGRVKDVVDYLETLSTVRAQKVLSVLYALRDHQYVTVTSWAMGMRQLSEHARFGWIKKELGVEGVDPDQ